MLGGEKNKEEIIYQPVLCTVSPHLPLIIDSKLLYDDTNIDPIAPLDSEHRLARSSSIDTGTRQGDVDEVDRILRWRKSRTD